MTRISDINEIGEADVNGTESVVIFKYPSDDGTPATGGKEYRLKVGPILQSGVRAEVAAGSAEAAAAQTSLSAAGAAVAAEEARAAANATGVIDIQATYADALARLATYAENAIVEVIADETVEEPYTGSRTRYRVESGTLVYKVNMDQLRQDLASANGASRICIKLANPFRVRSLDTLFAESAIPLSTLASTSMTEDDLTAAVVTVLGFCLVNRRTLYIPKGNWRFGEAVFDAADYDKSTYDERGIVIIGDGRQDSRLNGHLVFKSKDTPSAYADRFSGLSLRDLAVYNESGDALTLSGYGKAYTENCLIRGSGGRGLSLLGGSEFAAYNTEIYGSLVNLYVRPTTIDGVSVDCAVIAFYECSIANPVGSGVLNIDYQGNGRVINFFGGNVISSNGESQFVNGQVNFFGVDFENTYVCSFSDCYVTARGCLFAVPSAGKIRLSGGATFVDDCNLWDASVTNNINITDEASRVALRGMPRAAPTITLSHTSLTRQLLYDSELRPFPNSDFSLATFAPYSPSSDVYYDTGTYATGGRSLYMGAGGYINLPVKSDANLLDFAAIEFVATSSNLGVYDGTSVIAITSLGLVYALQDFGNGLKRYVFMPRTSMVVRSIRYTFSSTSHRFDSCRIFGPVNDTMKYPGIPTWIGSVGDVVYNRAPAASGHLGYVYTASGWKTFGAISA